MSKSILIIDDSLMVRRQVGGLLRELGYIVVEAVDGVDALEKLDATASVQLIVCDVNMPRMNGIELLESLRGRASTIPIIMLTTEGHPELIEKARALGAKGWLIKPFKPEFLAATAKKLVPLTS
jgi:two-component system chemotaxis response regulator CheY